MDPHQIDVEMRRLGRVPPAHRPALRPRICDARLTDGTRGRTGSSCSTCCSAGASSGPCLPWCGRWGASVTAAGSPPPSTPVATHSIGSTTSARASCATAHSARDDRAAGPHHRCAPVSPGRRDQAQSDTEHAHADRFGSVLRTHDGCSRRLVVGTHTFGPSAGSVRAPATAGQGPTPDFWHSTPSWRTGGPAIEPARGPDGRSSTAAAQTRRDHA